MTATSYAYKRYYDSDLTAQAKRRLRLVHIFKAAMQVIRQDVKRNKFKIICFASFPTTTTVTSFAFIAMGVTQNARAARKQIKNSVSEPVNYSAYKDFYCANFNGQYDMDMKKFYKHVAGQKYAMTLNDLHAMSARYQKGVIGGWFRRKLKRHMTKGELTLVA